MKHILVFCLCLLLIGCTNTKDQTTTNYIEPTTTTIMTTTKDLNGPKIYLNRRQLVINQGDNFDLSDVIVYAKDDIDGDLTNSVKMDIPYTNNLYPGIYNVVYSVTDSDNNSFQTTLPLYVNAPGIDLNEEYDFSTAYSVRIHNVELKDNKIIIMADYFKPTVVSDQKFDKLTLTFLIYDLNTGILTQKDIDLDSEHEFDFSALKEANGYIYIVGSVQRNGEKIPVIVKMDDNYGNPHIYYLDYLSNLSIDLIQGIAINSDGKIAIIANENYITNSYLIILTLDEENYYIESTYTKDSTDRLSFYKYIIADQNDFIVSGYSSVPADTTSGLVSSSINGLMTKFNSKAELMWTYLDESHAKSQYDNIKVLDDGSYFISGSYGASLLSVSYPLFVNISNEGTLISDNDVYSNLNYALSGEYYQSNDNYVIGTYTNNPFSDKDISPSLVITDKDFNILNTFRFQIDKDTLDSSLVPIVLGNDVYVIYASSYSVYTGQYSMEIKSGDLHIVKITGLL